MEFPNHGQLKGEKLQFVGGVVDLSLHQTPAGIGYDSISPIIMSLIEDSPRLDPQALVWSLKGLIKSA